MIIALLFIFGMVFGSFGYVLALRYDEKHFLLDPKIVGGRSYCPHCKKTLKWHELIPFVSFAIQGGKCRNCKARISFIYPLIEVFCGLLFVAIAYFVHNFYMVSGVYFWIFTILWIAFFFALLLISIIDIRIGIIPNELVWFLSLLSILIVIFSFFNFGSLNNSFLGQYGVLFGIQNNIWINHILGALFSFILFGGLVAITKGRGMGFGDVKLSIPLGFAFGWPDVIFLFAFAFILGAIVGLFYITIGKKNMKSSLPFGPFLALGALIIFFYGFSLLNSYFHILGIA
jgi:leader peptidase (prepilin peptidase)/N-methyltransferase